MIGNESGATTTNGAGSCSGCGPEAFTVVHAGTVRRRGPALLLAVGVLAAGCTSTSTPDGADALALATAMSPGFVSDGPLPIDEATAACLGDGIVEVIGVEALNDVGITIEDPDGPDDDVYAALTRDQLADVVVVWRACTGSFGE